MTAARQSLGRLGERLAAKHLERLGYRILERNHRTRYGEIDLVAVGRRESPDVADENASCGDRAKAVNPSEP